MKLAETWMLTGHWWAEYWGRLLLGYTPESDVLRLGQSWNRAKRGIVERTRAETPIFEPHRRKDGPSCCPVTSSHGGFFGCPQAGGWQGRLGSKNEQAWEEKVGSTWMILACMPSEAWFRRRGPTCGWLRTSSSLNYKISTINAQYVWHSCLVIRFLMWCNTILKDEFYSCPALFCPKALSQKMMSLVRAPR